MPTKRHPVTKSSSVFEDGFLLLGAGASVEARVPDAFRFIDAIRTYVEGLQPASTRQALLAAYDEALRRLEKVYGPDNVSLEPLYEAIDDSLEDHFKGGLVPGIGVTPILPPSRALERLHYEIKRVIQMHCVVTDGSRGAYLHPLLRRLADFTTIPIVTFNYDNVIESSCQVLGFDCKERVLGETLSGHEFELVKVHGSVTWLADKNGELKRSPLLTQSVIRRLGAVRSPTLETPMIYPSRRKMPLHGPFMRNALRLQELLGTQRACIAVGYSFPDAHVRAWLSEALSTNSELTVYLVDPDPGRAIRNLVTNLPTIRWKDRLRIVQKGLGQAVAEGFEECIEKSHHFGPGFGDIFKRLMWNGGNLRCFSGQCAGLGASPDGSSLYISEGGGTGRVFRVPLKNGQAAAPELFAQGLKDPRGVAVSEDGDVFVVHNRLFRRGPIPTTGIGGVVRISPNGRRKSLVRFRLAELRGLLKALNNGNRSAELWSLLPSLLRWPTDIAITADGTVYVTESRALVQLTSTQSGAHERPYEGGLLFNFHGLDAANDGVLVGVEQGIAQDSSWGRVHRFEKTGSHMVSSVGLEGVPKLMGICFVPPLQKVVVTKGWSWPLGGLYTLDYPDLDNPRFLGGFDMPQKIEYVPSHELLAISTPGAVDLIPLKALEAAYQVRSTEDDTEFYE